MPRAIVVVPCYNEAKRLNLRAFEAFGRRDSSAELLFVNDGSRDETLEMLERLNAAHPDRFSFLHLAQNGGKAEAVRRGIMAALRSGTDYVGYWDADLATPLEDIDRFTRVLDTRPKTEVVVGTRMRLLGHDIQRHPLRHVLGRVFARTASLALGIPIYDTQCGAKLFRVTPHTTQIFDQPFLTHWIFDVELFARLQIIRHSQGLRPLAEAMYEMPLDRWEDVAGSKVKSGDFVKAAFEMATIYRQYLRMGAPLATLPLPHEAQRPSTRRADHPDRRAA